MKNILGPPARGDDFYKRLREIKMIQEGIESGMHMQIAAPRRVGKTSVLQYFKDNPINGYYFVFVDTESVNEENEYYRKLYAELIRSDAFSSTKRIIEQIKSAGNQFLRRAKGVKIGNYGIDLVEADDINYKDELSDLLKGLDLDGKKIVMMVDEFPETILNIYKDTKEDLESVQEFLKSNRTLRQDPDISDKIIFIYTGSIGLNHTVAKFDATHAINDLHVISISPLKPEEAKELINLILGEKKFGIKIQESDHLIAKVEWLMPFHIKLVLKEIMDMYDPEIEITNEIVDSAFDALIEYRNNSYFDHYKARLKRTFDGNDFSYAMDVLKHVADNPFIDSAKLYDMAVPYSLENSYKNIIEILMYDGYINNNEDHTKYRFNSPIVKMWWKKYVSN